MIATGRLILRRPEERDRATIRRHCADPRVMRQLGPLQTDAETDAAVARHDALFAANGYGFWAVERRADGALLGVCGLKPGAPDTPIAGELEIGWRFGAEHWGQGYAREAAEASLAVAWAQTDAPHVAAITAAANVRSRALIDRLGMTHDPAGDFVHALLLAGYLPGGHVTYRILRPLALGAR